MSPRERVESLIGYSFIDKLLVDRLEMYDADLNVLRAEACQVIAKKVYVLSKGEPVLFRLTRNSESSLLMTKTTSSRKSCCRDSVS